MIQKVSHNFSKIWQPSALLKTSLLAVLLPKKLDFIILTGSELNMTLIGLEKPCWILKVMGSVPQKSFPRLITRGDICPISHHPQANTYTFNFNLYVITIVMDNQNPPHVVDTLLVLPECDRSKVATQLGASEYPAAVTPLGQYFTPGELEALRPVIQHLYIDECYTFRQVQLYLHTHHNYLPTWVRSWISPAKFIGFPMLNIGQKKQRATICTLT